MAKLRHLALQVPDLDKAADFYKSVFDMEQVVRGVSTELSLDVLAKAMKLADPAVTAKIRGAMGINMQRELDEIIETTPAKMRVKDIEDEQRKILKVVKEMIYSGQIEMEGELI